QESFGQWLRDECARSNSRLEIAFRMKSRESDVYSETRHSQICRQIARGWESGRVVVESCRTQLIANLAIKLFMKRFIPRAFELNCRQTILPASMKIRRCSTPVAQDFSV